MTIKTHILGYPRIGKDRKLKTALEAYWRKESTQSTLEHIGAQIRSETWKTQKDTGLNWTTVGDFAWYDHVLTTTLMLGCIPKRFSQDKTPPTLDTLFDLARGTGAGEDGTNNALGLTKWFNTNYHYLVPELHAEQTFSLQWTQLFSEIDEAQTQGHTVKPVLLGPLSFLYLAKTTGSPFDKLQLLPRLIPIYQNLFERLAQKNVEWVQVDEPILVLDLPIAWQEAYLTAYAAFNTPLKLLLTTYFGSINHQLSWLPNLAIDGLHIDCTATDAPWEDVLQTIPETWICSLGIIQGRNVWKGHLHHWYEKINPLPEAQKKRLWLGTACSLLHCPQDLSQETKLDNELRSWLAFAVQKCQELQLLQTALEQQDPRALMTYVQPLLARLKSSRVNNITVQRACAAITPQYSQRQSPYTIRAKQQKAQLQLPLLPTTTIGSFPQTPEIRKLRRDFKKGQITPQTYQYQIQDIITQNIRWQEEIGLDVLVHGEPERNDMVEYFGELFDGCAITENGWVQSYGSRCVKPPIIFADIARKQAMTCDWIAYAQSLTSKPVKGMLTGPVTLLCWSFPREDIKPETSAFQFALALRDEVHDLEQRGIRVIQIDEPAFREGLPLRQQWHQHYLDWAVQAFHIASCGVADTTQIHTHMCYSDFNLILDAVAQLDADVITIETSRSHMRLLEAFEQFAYPNEIGPGVYDVHSPRTPSREWVLSLLNKAANLIPIERLWVNPDCGLKTRTWPETKAALIELVQAAKSLRVQYGNKQETSEAIQV